MGKKHLEHEVMFLKLFYIIYEFQADCERKTLEANLEVDLKDNYILNSNNEEPKTHSEDWPLLLKVFIFYFKKFKPSKN
jgi:hypothetical protein